MPRFAALLLLISTAAAANPPVVLLNGLGGAALEAKLERTSVVKRICSKKSDWFTLWLSVEELLPDVVDCFTDNIVPRYNAVNRTYANPDGVQIRAKDFGGVSGISYLDPSIKIGPTAYFEDLIKFLEQSDAGYRVGVDLFGAPYDWRFAPDGLAQVGYFDALRELIENATQPVTLVTHSMGGPVALAFLNRQPAAWKAQHIKAFVPISPPFGGAVSTAMSMISGDNFGVSVMNPRTFRPIQAACASGPWLLPQPALWASNETVVHTAGSSYGAEDWPRLLADLGLGQASNIYAVVRHDTLEAFDPPMVDVHVMHGLGVPTAASYEYGGNFSAGVLPSPPLHTAMEDGDGTVNTRSLRRAADEWTVAKNGGKAVQTLSFANQSHFGLLKDEAALQQLLAIVLSQE